MKINILMVAASAMLVFGCRTVDVEKERTNTTEELRDEDLLEEGDISDDEYMTRQILKENDVESAVVFIEPPETRTVDSKDYVTLTGAAAVKKHLEDVTKLPEYDSNRLKAWLFKKGNVYQIACQTYHSTLIQLEPGEELLETPYLSESEVWRLSYGNSIEEGLLTPLLIVKPDFANMITTMTIVTNRRIYLLELKSFRDHYMPYVKWVYPELPKKRQSISNWENEKKAVMEFTGENVENLSFDYRIKHKLYGKPSWTPTLAYDDGRKTYIVLDKKSINMEMPTLFKKNREITNKEIRKNVIVINELVERLTLRLGKDKVTVEKKKSKEK